MIVPEQIDRIAFGCPVQVDLSKVDRQTTRRDGTVIQRFCQSASKASFEILCREYNSYYVVAKNVFLCELPPFAIAAF